MEDSQNGRWPKLNDDPKINQNRRWPKRKKIKIEDEQKWKKRSGHSHLRGGGRAEHNEWFFSCRMIVCIFYRYFSNMSNEFSNISKLYYPITLFPKTIEDLILIKEKIADCSFQRKLWNIIRNDRNPFINIAVHRISNWKPRGWRTSSWRTRRVLWSSKRSMSLLC